MKRVSVSIPDRSWEIVEKELKEKLERDSEIMWNMVLAYLPEEVISVICFLH